MRVLIVEDESLLAEAIRDGLRLEAIAADIAGDGDTALALGEPWIIATVPGVGYRSDNGHDGSDHA